MDIIIKLFHSRLKNYLFSTNPSHLRLLLPIGLPSWQWDWTGPIMLIVLFLVSHFNFLFVPCGGLSWLPISFLLHVKYTVSYRIVSYIRQYMDHLSHTEWATRQTAIQKSTKSKCFCKVWRSIENVRVDWGDHFWRYLGDSRTPVQDRQNYSVCVQQLARKKLSISASRELYSPDGASSLLS